LEGTLPILAGFGFDALIQRYVISEKNKRSVLKSRILLSLLGMAVILVLFSIFQGIPRAVTDVTLPFIFMFAVLGHLLPSTGHQIARASLGGLFLFSFAAQLHAVNWTAPKITDSDYLRLNLVRLESALSHVRQLDPKGDFRIIFGEGLNNQIAAMLASYQGVRSLNSFVNPLPFIQFNELYHHTMQRNKYHNGLGAKFLLCRKCPGADTYGYQFLETFGDYSIYFSDDVLPRFYVTNRVVGNSRSLEDYIQIISRQDLRELPVVLPQDNFYNFSP
jgi:hypothetical protein